jgi:2'-5' RNA ligase
MRLFIAVPIPKELKEKVGRLIADLSLSGADYKWVVASHLHLTLAFLGETSEEKLPALEDCLSRVAAGQEPFELSFTGLGAFDSFDYPRVVWLSVGKGVEELKGVAQDLRGTLYGAGLLAETGRQRTFQGHLTLGRMRSSRNLERLKDRLKQAQTFAGLCCRAENLVLYKSQLLPQGPTYTVLRDGLLGRA